jgi:RHS repeat-associated protein
MYRGRLLEKRDFDNNDNIVHKTTNTYDIRATNSIPVRALRRNISPGRQPSDGEAIIMRTLAYTHHLYPILLTKTTETFYFPNPITTSIDYQYDGFRNMIEQKTTNSDEKIHKKLFFYKSNVLDSHPNVNTTEFETFKMNGLLLETRDFYNNTLMGGSAIEYQVLSTDQRIYPYKYYRITTDEQRLNLVTIDQIEVNGNPKKVLKRGFNTTTFDTYSWEQVAKTRLLGRKIESSGNILEWIYNYNNEGLLKSITDENGISTSFDYDKLQRLEFIKAKFTNNDTALAPTVTTQMSYNYGGTTNLFNNYVESKTKFSDNINFQTTRQISDGLGKPVQITKIDYTPDKKNQKNLITYDIMGRTNRVYQPFESIGANFESISSTTPQMNKPYVYSKYEASPLSRPIEQYNEDNTKTTMEYSTNLEADAVKQFKTTAAGGVVTSGDLAKGKPTIAMNYSFDAALSQGIPLELVPDSEWSANPAEVKSWIIIDLQMISDIKKINFKVVQLQNNASAIHRIYVSNTLTFPTTTGEVFVTNSAGESNLNYIPIGNLSGRYIKIETYAGANIRACWSKIEIFSETNTSYAANTLYKTTMTDENLHKTIVFKDKIGRNVLTRKIAENNQNVDTYNVYDDYGNLVMVIPPGACDANGAIIDNLVFKYAYDSQHRPTKKKVPGAEEQSFYYDDRDLLTLTQDGNQKALNRFLATKYDAIGRVVKTGFVPASAAGATQAAIEAFAKTDFAIAAADILSETSYQPNKSLVAQTKVKVIGYKKAGDADFITTNYNYDQWARPIATASNSHYSTNPNNIYANNIYHSTSLSNNDLPNAQITQIIGPDLAARTIRQEFNYDHSFRLEKTFHQHNIFSLINDEPSSLRREVANLKYDFQDKVIEKNLGRKSTNLYLQSIDFQYNTRNWLTNINSGDLAHTTGKDYPLFKCDESSTVLNNYNGTYANPDLVGNDLNPDLFTQVLRYDNPVTTIGSVTPQYNGNIAQIQWQVGGREAQAYSYTYDALNRMTNAQYTDIHTGTGNGWSNPIDKNNRYNEQLTYDVRGNIMSLLRGGQTDKGLTTAGLMCGSFASIDNLGYTYNDKNQVTKIMESASSTIGFKYNSAAGTGNPNSDHYLYDANGNLIKDGHKKISRIEYNHLNLPELIEFVNNLNFVIGKILFTYDASGKKWRKTVVDVFIKPAFERETYRDYIDGIEYVGSSGSLGTNPTIKPDIIHHTEGYVQYDETTLLDENWQGWVYKYTLKDHLGNTRVTLSDKNDDGYVTTADIEQTNHYYPFGLNMEGNWNGASGAFKYQYNGIELNSDFGVDINMAVYRAYDPAVGRWWQRDPKPNFSESLYSAMGNNPIRFSDRLGDTVRAVNSVSGGRTQTLFQNGFDKMGMVGYAMARLVKLGKDGLTLNGITKSQYKLATLGMNKDQKAIAKGYYNAVNSQNTHLVEVVKGRESLTSTGQNVAGLKNRDQLNERDGGGLSKNASYDGVLVTGASNAFGNEGSYNFIAMDVNSFVDVTDGNKVYSSKMTPEEIIFHELIGHGLGTKDQESIQVSNIYRRAIGENKYRTGGDHSDDFEPKYDRKGIPNYLNDDDN